MITETATVVEADDKGYALVATQRTGACGSCGANKVCGTAVLDGVIGRKIARLRVRNPVAARPGQTVEIGIDDAALVKSSALMYLLPLVLLLGGAAAGQWLSGEAGAIIGAALGLLVGFGGLRRWLRGTGLKSCEAVILRSM